VFQWGTRNIARVQNSKRKGRKLAGVARVESEHHKYFDNTYTHVFDNAYPLLLLPPLLLLVEVPAAMAMVSASSAPLRRLRPAVREVVFDMG